MYNSNKHLDFYIVYSYLTVSKHIKLKSKEIYSIKFLHIICHVYDLSTLNTYIGIVLNVLVLK